MDGWTGQRDKGKETKKEGVERERERDRECKMAKNELRVEFESEETDATTQLLGRQSERTRWIGIEPSPPVPVKAREDAHSKCSRSIFPKPMTDRPTVTVHINLLRQRIKSREQDLRLGRKPKFSVC